MRRKEQIQQELNKELSNALCSNNLEKAKLLIKSGADINQVGVNGFTLLYQSIIYDELDKAKFLIKSGADINQVGVNDLRPPDLIILSQIYAFNNNQLNGLSLLERSEFLDKLKKMKFLIESKAEISHAVSNTDLILQAKLVDNLFVENVEESNDKLDLNSLSMLSKRYNSLCKIKEANGEMTDEMNKVIENNFHDSSLKNIFGDIKFFSTGILPLQHIVAQKIANDMNNNAYQYDFDNVTIVAKELVDFWSKELSGETTNASEEG